MGRRMKGWMEGRKESEGSLGILTLQVSTADISGTKLVGLACAT